MKITLRIWILIIVLLLSVLAIGPWQAFEKGVVVKSVEQNSSVFNAGLKQGMIIQEINNQRINNAEDYTKIISGLFQENNQTRLTIKTNQNEIIFLADKAPEITTQNIPNTRLKTGLDLSGGARALVKPANISVSSGEINDLIAITSQRFNVYGLTDITLRAVKDLTGNNYMLVEIAGSTPDDLENLIAQQGKFEAKIGSQTVFIGGNEDITHVGRTGEDAVITDCFTLENQQEACTFRFLIFLSEKAAQKHADITQNLAVNGSYLNQTIDFYIDEIKTSSLNIGSDLKGNVATQVQITGSEIGATQNEAYNNAKSEMKKLQTILVTGSLPYKLEIVKIDTISPVLGKEFIKNIMFLAAIVFIIISVILFIKYKKIKITLSVVMTMFSEALITLAIAALINWNLDAPSIAGIIAGMGTGVNDQIVIIDESVSNLSLSLKERIKRALFIILGAFFTIIAAMLPLFWAGAGMLRGFALTTIISISAGILITRPAFADIIKQIQQD